MEYTRDRIKSDYTRERMVQCPNCRGQGVTHGPQRNMPWFDCQWCKGEGDITEEDALAHGWGES